MFVAVGGRSRNDSEILDLDAKVWRSGPELDYQLNSMACVAFEDTFLLVGGYDYYSGTTSTYFDTVLQFEPETETLFEMNIKLQGPLREPTAMMVSDKVVQCNKRKVSSHD